VGSRAAYGGWIIVTAGIYAIVHMESGCAYIGSSIDIRIRWRDHKYNLNLNKHRNLSLQAAWNKYGIDAFDFRTLQQMSDNNLLVKQEQKWLDKYRQNGGVYNTAIVVKAPRLGRKSSEETKRKIGLAHKGKRLTSEHKERLRQINTGKRHTKETRHKISRAFAKPYPSFTNPKGIIYPKGRNLLAFCRAHNLINSCMYRLVSGERKLHRGWILTK